MRLQVVASEIVQEVDRVIYSKPDCDRTDQQGKHIQRDMCHIHDQQSQNDRGQVGNHTQQSQPYRTKDKHHHE